MNRFLLLFLLLTGCSTTFVPQNQNPDPPLALPAAISSITNVAGEDPVFTSDEIEPRVYACSVVYGGELLRFDYLQTEETSPKGLVFIYRILNDPDGIISGLISDILLDEGFDCIVLQQENFLSKKFIRPIVSIVEPYGYDEYNARLARGVGRIIHYWLPQQNRLDGGYAFVGISMGGIHAIGAAALFPESRITVAIMAGGGNSDLMRLSQESLVIYNREHLLDQYAIYLAETYPNRRMDVQGYFYGIIDDMNFDVLRLAKSIETSKVRLMISLEDTSVPTPLQWNLYHALRGPETRLFPCGHYSLALYYFTVKEQLKQWMNGAFED